MLRAIEPQHLAAEWERVRAGLIEVKKATTDDWLPEDVYMSLRQGHSTLYIGTGAGGEYVGFLVLRLVPTFHSKAVEVWCAYSASKRPLMRRFFPHVQAVARNVGATLISFASARDEWEAGARKLGFHRAKTTYHFPL